MQPLAFTHHFGGHSRGHSMYPTAPAAWTNPGVPANTGRRGVAEVVAVWALVNSPCVISVRTRASEGATFCTPTGSAP